MSDRALGVKMAAFAAETWSAAQQEMSALKSYTVPKSLDGGTFKLFPVAQKRTVREKGAGVVDTPRTAQSYIRRAMFSKSYHDANAIDADDQADAQVNVLEDSKMQMANAFGRTADSVILDSIVSPVQETEDASEDADGLLTAVVDLNKRYRNNAFAKAGAAGELAAFGGDDLEDVGYIFASRDVSSKLCATLTPELQRILRKDADFKNAESIYSTRDTGGMVKDIEYKGITFIKVSNDVLPIISERNIGSAANANRNADQAIQVRSLKESNNVAPHLSAARLSKAQLKAATEADTATVTCRSIDLAYFWAKSALYFTSRDELNFASMKELPEKSEASQIYMRVNFGALLIEDAQGLIVPVKGRTTAALS